MEVLARSGLAVRNAGRPDADAIDVVLDEAASDRAIELVRLLRANDPMRKVLVLQKAPQAESRRILALLGAGASDILPWRGFGRDADGLLEAVRHWDLVLSAMESPLVADRLVGRSYCWLEAVQSLVEAALFSSHPVLITGESGTGKELAARLVHDLDPRAPKGALIVLDASTVSSELAGSEFFGHERGAFTSALSMREGAFALADGGTLFLDEVGELPPRLQAELLRATQEGTYKRVGGNQWFHSSFRLVAATNRDLEQGRREGTFREDFFHRLAAWKCRLPPLRERRADILPLMRHFLREERPCPDMSEDGPVVDDCLAELLEEYPWPGNVRELRQMARRLAVRWKGRGPVTLGCLPESERPAHAWMPSAEPISPDRSGVAGWAGVVGDLLLPGLSLSEIKERVGDAVVQHVLGEEGGSVQKAAQRLKVTERAIQIRLKNLREIDETEAIPG